MSETTSGLWDPGDVYRRIAQSSWVSATPEQLTISATPGPSATVTTYSGYIVFKFTSSGTLNVSSGVPGTADVLCVKGGAPGASSGPTVPGNPISNPMAYSARPGGAGGLVLTTPSHTITSNSTIPVVVGGANTDSTFGVLSSATGTPSGTAGGGAVYPGNLLNNHQPGGSGGSGILNNYETGSPIAYGGGGGGGGWASPGLAEARPLSNPQVPAPGGGGGSGGGGAGGPSIYGGIINLPRDDRRLGGSPGSAGSPNTGGGGGGAGAGAVSNGVVNGGAGGSGVVIIRFPNTQFRI